jgi:predicted porin
MQLRTFRTVGTRRTQFGRAAARGPARVWGGLVLGVALAIAGSAQAQTKTGPDPAADNSLTWNGITLFGIIDIGLQSETHGAPFSDYHPAGSANIVQKNSRQSVTGLTPSNMSQSRIGLSALEPLGVGDWAVVAKVETFFNPQSGDISDASKSMALNNGKTAATSGTNLNSSVAGQLFQSSYLGFSSKTYGTITFGRQLTLVADGINKYDPNYGSQAFSLIGMSGPYAGAGDTEDKRLDSSVKYNAIFADVFHVGALYKFNGSNGAANTAFQAQLGAEFDGASVDAYYSKVKSAISSAPLTAAMVQGDPVPGFTTCVPTCSIGNNSLAGTISDNTAYALMGLYKLDEFKFFLGYEYLEFKNPSQPLPAGFIDIGGYVLAYVNNNAYVNPKILNVYWGGLRYTPIPHLDLTAAYYGFHQNSFATGAHAGCDSKVSGACSGNFDSFSFDADYAFTKRFDAYIGAMYSGVHNGLANGYDFHTTNINPTVGLRFKF